MVEWPYNCLVGRLDGWKVGWLDGWMVGWSDVWMVGWWDGGMVGCSDGVYVAETDVLIASCYNGRIKSRTYVITFKLSSDTRTTNKNLLHVVDYKAPLV